MGEDSPLPVVSTPTSSHSKIQKSLVLDVARICSLTIDSKSLVRIGRAPVCGGDEPGPVCPAPHVPHTSAPRSRRSHHGSHNEHLFAWNWNKPACISQDAFKTVTFTISPESSRLHLGIQTFHLNGTELLLRFLPRVASSLQWETPLETWVCIYRPNTQALVSEINFRS